MLCLRNAPQSTVGNQLARVLEMLAEVVVLMCIEHDLNFQSAFTISLNLSLIWQLSTHKNEFGLK